MSFFDNIGKKMGEAAKSVGDAAKTATKKTEDMIEISKLNKSISVEQEKINRIYYEMGKTVYGRFQKNEEIDPALADSCTQIVEIEKNIDGLKEKIEDIKKAGEHNASQNSVYTAPSVQETPDAACAQNNPPDNTEVQTQFIPKEGVPQPEMPAEVKFCPSCGAKLGEGVKFCPSCGYKI